MIRYKCTQCGADLESSDELGMGSDKCPACGATCVVPMSKAQVKQSAAKRKAEEKQQQAAASARRKAEREESLRVEAERSAPPALPETSQSVRKKRLWEIDAAPLVCQVLGFMFLGLAFLDAYGMLTLSWDFHSDNAVGATANTLQALNVNVLWIGQMIIAVLFFGLASLIKLRADLAQRSSEHSRDS